MTVFCILRGYFEALLFLARDEGKKSIYDDDEWWFVTIMEVKERLVVVAWLYI
jgi:hypothetical protein